MNKIKRLAVFCGSKNGNDGIYAEQAKALGKLLAKHKVEVIYGGGKKGLMGMIADTVMLDTGIVRGVIPKVLTDWEHQHTGITELLVVDDMHIRKRKMYELCDGAVVLPGGFGTLDEFFEILTWNQLSIHDKPVFLLNTKGFYDHLINHIRHLSSEGFLWGEFSEQVHILDAPANLEAYLLR